jgi:hypothetical protein
MGKRLGFSAMVLIATSFSYLEGGGLGTGGAVSVASTSGETPLSMLFHSKVLKYFLGPKRSRSVFGARFRACGFDMTGISADRAGMKPSTGPRTGTGIVSATDLVSTFGGGSFWLCFRVFSA